MYVYGYADKLQLGWANGSSYMRPCIVDIGSRNLLQDCWTATAGEQTVNPRSPNCTSIYPGFPPTHISVEGQLGEAVGLPGENWWNFERQEVSLQSSRPRVPLKSTWFPKVAPRQLQSCVSQFPLGFPSFPAVSPWGKMVSHGNEGNATGRVPTSNR